MTLLLQSLTITLITFSEENKMLNRTEERIVHLLAAGLPVSQVASVIGVTPALISQLKTKPEFTEALEAATLEANKGDKEEVAITAKYHAAENILLDQVMAMAPVAELRDVTAALRTIGERQDRVKTRMMPASTNAGVVNNTIISLTLPAHALPEFRTNGENQIISIDSQPLAPLSSNGVADLFKKFTNKTLPSNNSNQENNDDISRTNSSTEGSSQASFSFA